MLAVTGKKNSGKTTVVVQLCAELVRRGHRVMSIKHGAHTFNIDPATTDTYRHYHEGKVERVAMAAPDKFALVMRWDEELAPEDIAARYMSDADIVICEGFKRSALRKVEVFRSAAHEAPLYDADSPDARDYIAIVTDKPALRAGVPVLDLGDGNWVGALADLVEREIMTC